MSGLAGRRVLVLRPRAQAERFARRIAERGGTALPFPTLEIRGLADATELDGVLGRLDSFDDAIFVSPNAVEQALAAVRVRGLAWPVELRHAAVGEGTAGVLRAAGLSPVLMPRAGNDSESLAAMPEMQSVAGREMVIFRGRGGREWLASVLQARGARVTYAECYERALPEVDAAPLAEALSAGRFDAICVWSSESWENFRVLLGAGATMAPEAPVFVPHPRVAAAVAASGGRAIVAEGGESGMLAELDSYFAGV